MAASAQSASAECDMPNARSKVRSGRLEKQSSGAFAVTRSRCIFALSDFDPRCRQQDQALEEHAQRAVSIRDLPKTFPGLMSFPVITVIEEVQTP